MGGHSHDFKNACFGWVVFVRTIRDIGGLPGAFPGLERYMATESLKEQLSGPDFYYLDLG